MAEKKKKQTEEEIYKAILDGYRMIIGHLTIEDMKFLSDLQGEDHRDFRFMCHQMANNKFFRILFDNLVYENMKHIAMETENNLETMTWRANAFGISQVDELIAKYAREWDEQYGPKGGEFDKHSAFPATATPEA